MCPGNIKYWRISATNRILEAVFERMLLTENDLSSHNAGQVYTFILSRLFFYLASLDHKAVRLWAGSLIDLWAVCAFLLKLPYHWKKYEKKHFMKTT